MWGPLPKVWGKWYGVSIAHHTTLFYFVKKYTWRTERRGRMP